ncbi:MAG: protein kinase [Candidatus Hydrogenedentales bacterium]|jgi:serine/threonine protein kinase
MAQPDEITDATPVDWSEGDVILGIYEVRRLLGRGGMGNVYQVYHRGWDQDLAVKCPKAEVLSARGGAESFERECEMWVNLGLHPNVASCYYVRRLGGVPRVFAEYVTGGTLSQWIHSGHLYRGSREQIIERVLDIAIQFAWGLRYSHAQGLVHQDVKPLNVLMTKEGVAKVTDFGLSRALYVASGAPETRSSKGLGSRGTPAYCSPEQASRGVMSQATDIWSWGISLFEMFVGDVTWMAGQMADGALDQYLELGPENERAPEMPDSILDLLRACFRDDPSQRPAGMADILSTLEAVYKDIVGQSYPRAVPQAAETTADRLNNRAVSLLDLGKQEEADQLWERALRYEPNHPESTYNRALRAWRIGRTTDMTMLHLARELCRLQPKDWMPVYMFAQLHLERGDYQAALELLERLQGVDLGGHEVVAAIETATERKPATRRLISTFAHRTGEVTAVCMSWDGHLALSATTSKRWPGKLTAWNVTTGERQFDFLGHTAPILSLALSADGLHAVSGSMDQTARVWEVVSADCIQVLQGHTGPVNSVVITDDGQGILTAGTDGTVRLWNRMSGQCERVFTAHRGEVTMLAPGRSGLSFLTIGSDGVLAHWEIKSGRRLAAIEGFSSRLRSLAVSNDRRAAMVGLEDGFVDLINLEGNQRVAHRKAHSEPVISVCLSKRGHFALTGVRGGKLRLWETPTGRCLHTFAGSAPVSIGGDESVALSGGGNGTLKLWAIGFGYPTIFAPMILCRAREHGA